MEVCETGVELCEAEVDFDNEVEVAIVEGFDVEVWKAVPFVRLPKEMVSGGSE